MERDMNWMAEYSVFAVMLGLSVAVGLYYWCVERKQNTVSEYLLGGRHMSVFPITLSLIASHVSGITLLGFPAEVYSYGIQYLMFSIINIAVVYIITYMYLPVFYELQLTSIYEYLEQRFNSKIRGISSLLFAVGIMLSVPLVIYLPALAFNQVTGLNIHIVSTIICSICIFYTTVGGLKAVVWTDAIQSFFTALSMIILIVLGLMQVGGIENTIRANQEGGRLEFFKMDLNPFLRNTFWTSSIGFLFTNLNSLGIHPGSVQRFVALPTYTKARKALFYYIIGMAVFLSLAVVVGLLVYATYKDCDPVMANFIPNHRYLVPYYVMDVGSKFPGITGLFVSGVVSAALSTMSANLNTVSGTIYEDFIVNIMGKKVSEFTASVIMKCITVVTGIICVLLVVVVEKLKGIVQISFSLSGATNGANLSVFTLGICFPWTNARGAMSGMLASLGIMTWIVTGAQIAIYNNDLKFTEKSLSVSGCPPNITINNYTDYTGLYRMNEDVYAGPNVLKLYTVSYLYYCAMGTFIGVAVGLVVSLLFPSDEKINPKLLAPCIRKYMYPEEMSMTEPFTVKAEECISISQNTKL